jgi:uncharacterized protein
MDSMNTHIARLPWYREQWPWLLMSGPALVVAAGLFTAYLAVKSNDGLVADDYYKRGLAINQTLVRDAVARRLKLHAHLGLSPEAARVTVVMAGAAKSASALVLRLAHPLRPALDRKVMLVPQTDSTYAGALPALSPGRWQVTLEDEGQTWRLVGDVAVPAATMVELVTR